MTHAEGMATGEIHVAAEALAGRAASPRRRFRRIFPCVKTPVLLTTRRISGTTCVENVLERTRQKHRIQKQLAGQASQIYICGFANANGGKIYIGIEDDASHNWFTIGAFKTYRIFNKKIFVKSYIVVAISAFELMHIEDIPH